MEQRRNLSRKRLALHPMEQAEILRVEALKKVYRSGPAELVVFDNLSFRVVRGEMLAIVGQSGSGKSTLLHIVGALDSPSDGEVYCEHVRLRSLSGDAAADFRNRPFQALEREMLK